MVANIRSRPSPSGALYYNKEKVDKDEAEVLLWQKMLEPVSYTHLDVYKRQGLPYSQLRTGLRRERWFDIVKVGVDMPRGELYDRINRRVDRMLADGLDVYKRQLGHCIFFMEHPINPVCDNRIARIHRLGSCRRFASVSYTHLDVYKRQIT